MKIIFIEYDENGEERKSDITDSLTSISFSTNGLCKISPEIFDNVYSIIERNRARIAAQQPAAL